MECLRAGVVTKIPETGYSRNVESIEEMDTGDKQIEVNVDTVNDQLVNVFVFVLMYYRMMD